MNSGQSLNSTLARDPGSFSSLPLPLSVTLHTLSNVTFPLQLELKVNVTGEQTPDNNLSLFNPKCLKVMSALSFRRLTTPSQSIIRCDSVCLFLQMVWLFTRLSPPEQLNSGYSPNAPPNCPHASLGKHLLLYFNRETPSLGAILHEKKH